MSLAIGKEGQNARLAAKLTGWKIDIKSESQIREWEEQAAREPLTEEAFMEKSDAESESMEEEKL